MKSILNKIKTIYFDFDGTLHETNLIYEDAFKKGIKILYEKGLIDKNKLISENAKDWLGYNPKDMWTKFAPNIDSNLINEISLYIGEEMKKNLLENRGKLYNGAKDTLNYLKNKGYFLIYLSNSSKEYRDLVNKIFALDKYFSCFLSSGEFNNISKECIIKKVRKNFKEEQIIIGDRIFDMDAGYKNNIKTIFCNYGYGKVEEGKNATIMINQIDDLKIYL